MQIERFETPGLAHYAYLVSCPGAGEAVVVDPRRDTDVYERYAADRGLAIRRVLETHVHADYASGARELALRTGAELCVSGHDEGETYEVAFEHRDLFDGDVLEMGSVRLEALHTPGHTPEHLAFLVYDASRSAEVPMAMLSGDFLFVGSLGRPDLLGEAAKRELASRMYDSVREKIAGLPDGVEVHPGHGAGSMCGAGMSGRPLSTLGFERVANPYLDPGLDREAFVDRLLARVPPFPPYYRRMKELNAAGPPRLDGRPAPRALDPAEFRRLLAEEGHEAIDLRDQLAFGGGHIPGAFGIGLAPALSEWAAWVVPYDVPLLLVPPSSADPDEAAEEVDRARRRLARVGLDDVRGYLRGGMQAWIEAGLPLAETPQVSPSELHELRAEGEGWSVLDVRTDAEWAAGHIEGAAHVMGGQLAERLDEVPADDRPLAVVCGGGYRSTVAASVLERAGRGRVWNVTGGMGAWKRAGLPTAAGEPTTSGAAA